MAYCMKLGLLLTLLCATHGKLPLEDASATVNQLFTYQIDPNDFTDTLIKVKEAGKETLPSWLAFDGDRSELVGVPTAKDRGTYILSVNEEMFAVTVAEPSKYQLALPTDVHEPTVCKGRDPITVAYVKLNADISAMLPQEKANLMHTFTAHLSLKPDHVSMSSQPSDLLDTNHALVSGAGDVPSTGDSLSALSWIVGCGAVKAHHMEILEKLESAAKDGSMSKSLATGVVGWQVQSNQPKALSKRRLKRQSIVTATPVPATTTVGESTTTKSPATTRLTPTAVITTTQTTPEATTVTTTEKKAQVTTQPTTETRTSAPANQKPVLDESLLPAELTASAGELVRWPIPEGLFVDPEGEELTYSVRSSVSTNEWLVTDQVIDGKLELVGIALESSSGRVEAVHLTATDFSGAKARTTINVKHGDSNKGSVTQMYKLKIKRDRSLRLQQNVIYLALTLQGRQLFTSVLVASVEQSPLTVVVGDNMGYQERCPKEANKRTLEGLKQMEGKDVSLVGHSEGVLHIQSLVSVTPVQPCADSKPMVNSLQFKQYQPLTVNLGELYESIIPVDLFTDEEDGDLSKMSLSLLVDGRKASNNWISYSSSSRRLQAFTWEMPESMPQLAFVVEDSAGNQKEESIQVSLKDNSIDPTNLVTLKLSTAYSVFANNYNSQVDLYRKLSNAFPESVVTFDSVKEGSVILAFSLRASTDSSNPPTGCDIPRMESYKKVLFDEDIINKDFAKQLDSYTIEQVDFLPLGVCEGAVLPKKGLVSSEVTSVPPPTKAGILPIIIIVIVVILLTIIIVIVIVCIRRKKAEKAKTKNQNGNDIEKRVPVVLDEEMKSLTRSENEPLVPSPEVTTKSTPIPPAYPGEDKYQPDTPPVSEPDDERRILDTSP